MIVFYDDKLYCDHIYTFFQSFEQNMESFQIKYNYLCEKFFNFNVKFKKSFLHTFLCMFL